MKPADNRASLLADLCLPLVLVGIISCNWTAIAQTPGPASGFSLAGNLADARVAHTATLLADGRVLVAGGGQGPDLIDGFWVVSGTELFNPTAGSFASAGTSAHDLHTATLLQSGQVLLVGGEGGWGQMSPIVTPTAELYDPATGSFQQTGSMAVARESHTATLLRDGRVLVAGGARPEGIGWEPLSLAEIYDPATSTFSIIGSMKEARYSHTATLLADGKVLITGGWNHSRLASAEVYDPATGSFTSTGSMSFQRSFHAATLLVNGQVLVSGGQPDAATIAEIYDPASGSFQSVGAMVTPRMWHTTTLLVDGTVLVVGGWGNFVGAVSSAELYDPATGSFAHIGDLSAPRFWHTATLLSDGSVLVVGGAGMSDGIHLDFISSAEIYK